MNLVFIVLCIYDAAKPTVKNLEVLYLLTMSRAFLNKSECAIIVKGYLRNGEKLLTNEYERIRQSDGVLELMPDLVIAHCVSYYFIPQLFPSLIVLDLDECVWSPETYELSCGKTGVIKGVNGKGQTIVTGVRFGSDDLIIYPGARAAFNELYQGRYDGVCNPNINDGNMRFAIASSAVTEHAVECANTALSTIEIEPGVTIRDVVNRGWNLDIVKNGHIQIGRSYPLSSNKSQTHFPFIQKATGVPYDEMLFFDDSNWSDNCGIVERNCVGVVAQRTPNGMQVHEWNKGLKKWQKRRANN